MYLDYYIMNDYFKFINKDEYIKFKNLWYPFLNLILFIIFFIILCTIFKLNININLDSIIFNTLDKGANIDNTTVNINDPNLNLSVSVNSFNNIAAAISSAGGVTAGLKVAQYIGGPPSTKILAGLGTMAVVQGTTAIMSKVLSNQSCSQDFVKKSLTASASNNTGSLNDYPLNLLFELNTLIYGALLFLIIILNIYIAKYIANINYNKYLPTNKFGVILNKIILRYIKIWNRTSNYLLMFSYIMLLIAILISKFTLWLIFNYYK